jgi:hypothetical protein
MFRRYNRWHSRFDQPDPYDGSYSLMDPQSFNRYAYTQNDPVNLVDPSGLDGETFFIVCWNGVCTMVGALIVNQAPGSALGGGSGGSGVHHGPLVDAGTEGRCGGGGPGVRAAALTPHTRQLPPCNVTSSGDVGGELITPFFIGPKEWRTSRCQWSLSVFRSGWGNSG